MLMPELPDRDEMATLIRKLNDERRRGKDEIEKRSIYHGSPHTAEQLHFDLITGKGRWKALGQLEWERKEAAAKAKAEGEELSMTPEPEF